MVNTIWLFDNITVAAAAAKLLQSCPTLCDPRDGSPRGSAAPGILQARTLEWVAISFSRAWKRKEKVKSFSRPTLSDPMDCSLPGSSIHRIFQAGVLEWVAIAFSGIVSCYVYICVCMSILIQISFWNDREHKTTNWERKPFWHGWQRRLVFLCPWIF